MDRPGPGGPPGSPSARSLLLVVLGEFVLPRQEPVWTGALLEALGHVGVEQRAGRQAVGRSARRGVLVSEHAGRRAAWRLTPAGTRLLSDGAARIFGFGQGIDAWDGRWLVVTVSLPEAKRHLRSRLRSRLRWAGLGSPVPGVWVTPDVDREKEAAAAIEELGLEGFSLVGTFGEIGRPPWVVKRAWSLGEVECRYRSFLRSFGRARPRTARERYRAQVRLVHDWSRFPYLDPALPSSLLPARWPGAAAARLFRERHEEWHEDAQRHWEALAAAAGERR